MVAKLNAAKLKDRKMQIDLQDALNYCRNSINFTQRAVFKLCNFSLQCGEVNLYVKLFSVVSFLHSLCDSDSILAS